MSNPAPADDEEPNPIIAAHQIIGGQFGTGENFHLRGVGLRSMHGTWWSVFVDGQLVDVVDADAFWRSREFLQYLEDIKHADLPNTDDESDLEPPVGRGVQ